MGSWVVEDPALPQWAAPLAGDMFDASAHVADLRMIPVGKDRNGFVPAGVSIRIRVIRSMQPNAAPLGTTEQIKLKPGEQKDIAVDAIALTPAK